MTPKQKAQELIDRFFNFDGIDMETAKECALICVDEIIEGIKGCYNIDGALPFYRQVRTEIK